MCIRPARRRSLCLPACLSNPPTRRTVKTLCTREQRKPMFLISQPKMIMQLARDFLSDKAL